VRAWKKLRRPSHKNPFAKLSLMMERPAGLGGHETLDIPMLVNSWRPDARAIGAEELVGSALGEVKPVR